MLTTRVSYIDQVISDLCILTRRREPPSTIIMDDYGTQNCMHNSRQQKKREAKAELEE